MPDITQTPDNGGAVELSDSELADAVAPPPLNLWEAVHAAMIALDPVAKTSTAEVKKDGRVLYTYKFVSTEDMMAAARDALLGAGLIVQRTGYQVRHGSGFSEVVSTFRLIHVKSGEIETFTPGGMPIPPSKNPDKGLAGALTYAWAYFLRDLLAIPRPDENEPDRRKDARPDFNGETPRESSRKVTRKGNGGGEPRAGTRKVTKAQPEGEDPRKVQAARSAMVKAAKELVAAHEQVGKPDVDVFSIAGAAVYGEDEDGRPVKRWSGDDPHTIAEYETATREFSARTLELLEAADPPAQDDVPEVCPACGFTGGEHEEGCPEAGPAAEGSA